MSDLSKTRNDRKLYGSKVYHPLRDKNYRFNEETDTVYFERNNGKWAEMPNE